MEYHRKRSVETWQLKSFFTFFLVLEMCVQNPRLFKFHRQFKSRVCYGILWILDVDFK